MGTKAAFFIGKGKKATFLFGVLSDGYPMENDKNGVPQRLLTEKIERGFKDLLFGYSQTVPLNEQVNDGVNWQNAGDFNYIYAFFDGNVWITRGKQWFNPFIRVKPPKSLPPPPIFQKGTVEGGITVTCGLCCRKKTITAEKLLACENKGLLKLQLFFFRKGFELYRSRGWLCKKCHKKL
jgi:hypothetical protein